MPLSPAPLTWADYLQTPKPELAARLCVLAQERAALHVRIGFLESEIAKTEAKVFLSSDYDTVAARDREAKSATSIQRAELAVKTQQLMATTIEHDLVARILDGK